MSDVITESVFDAPVFRYTVRTPESRHGAIKARAERCGLTPGQLVQALFDRIDLTRDDGDIAAAIADFNRLFPAIETTRQLSDRARSVGLTVRELKVFRALSMMAGAIRVVRPHAMDVAARSGVSPAHIDGAIDRLVEKGFIAVAPSTGRGRRAYSICRMPDL